MRTSVLLAGVLLLTACGGGGGGDATAPAPVSVAAVIIDPPSATLLVGGAPTLTATTKDASGNTLAGRTISWTSSNAAVATVSTSGVVTGVAAGGPVAITATSEGRSAAALVTVVSPITSVTITGALNVKVGDTYGYSATLRTADGSEVARSISWSVADPTRASITTSGALTPLQAGAITLRLTVDGTVWTGTTTAYDWAPFGSGPTFGVALPSDTRITNKFGTSENPILVIGCSSGTLLAFVDTDHFVTHNGLVAYSFDGAPVVTQTWLEIDSFSALGFPGPTSATRLFATLMTQARTFAFGFTEFNSTVKAMIFRVTGAGTRIGAWITQCPASMSSITSSAARGQVGAPTIGATGAPEAAGFEALLGASGRGTIASAESALRAELRASRAGLAPGLRMVEREATTQRAWRIPQ